MNKDNIYFDVKKYGQVWSCIIFSLFWWPS